jgi:sortase (surface protein transpeptidase)
MLTLMLGVALGGLAVWLVAGGNRDRIPAEAPPAFDLLTEAPSTEVAPPETLSAAPITQETAPEPTTLQAPEPAQSSTDAREPSPVDFVGPAETARPTSPVISFASGSIQDLSTNQKLQPVRILIPSLNVDAQIDPVGYDDRKDRMEVPRSASVAGWYEYGPSPGDSGSSVISAHVDWGGKKGVFFDLRKLEPYSLIVVEYEDGTQRSFAAVIKETYDKQDLPVNELFAPTGDPVLTLITCGGAFNPSLRSYEDNVVVQALEIPTVDGEARQRF